MALADTFSEIRNDKQLTMSLLLLACFDIQMVFVWLSVALGVRGLLADLRLIPSPSMHPSIEIGDQIVVEKITKLWRDYKRGDVISFKPTPSLLASVDIPIDESTGFVKRIVALEGDVVEIKKGRLLINGAKQDEPYTSELANYDFGPFAVPRGCVFVLGDNRNDSVDSHVWGALPKANIIGRATLKYWPLDHFGRVPATPS